MKYYYIDTSKMPYSINSKKDFYGESKKHLYNNKNTNFDYELGMDISIRITL